MSTTKNELNDYLDKVIERLEEFEKRQSQSLFKNLKLKDENTVYKNECANCHNTNVINSSKYVLQRCNKCRIEYEPKILEK